ncbi:unnamed protein product [Phytophthora lilii]|uniref:Unnamed protein product n=1 Tax=Phytophthora lilii TaxID=2077276 RepID=A0A9W6YKW5_9STRA|nr:unnamed protein product [Phytophthora lilii]
MQKKSDALQRLEDMQSFSFALKKDIAFSINWCFIDGGVVQDEYSRQYWCIGGVGSCVPPNAPREGQYSIIPSDNIHTAKPTTSTEVDGQCSIRLSLPQTLEENCAWAVHTRGRLRSLGGDHASCKNILRHRGAACIHVIRACHRLAFEARLLASFAPLCCDYAAHVVVTVVNDVVNVVNGDMGSIIAAKRCKWVKGVVYYKVANLDSQVSNADQLLTVDVERFSNSVTELYMGLAKPLLDIGIDAAKLTSSVGGQAPAIKLSYLVTSGMLLTWLRQPLGRLTTSEQQAEGTFRFLNSRLITHGEEIAFYNGNTREMSILQDSFRLLMSRIRSGQQVRIAVGAADTIVAKYLAIVVGYYTVSKSFMDASNTGLAGLSCGERMEDYFRSGKMMINLAEATGRLSSLQGRELQYRDHVIEFENVPLVTPNDDVLVPSLHLKVTTGMNVVVVGPNGCGKSSLFRILGELWPLHGGKLTKPPRTGLFYIPQRPYLTLGSLRDQAPHSLSDMSNAGRSDEDLMYFLEMVQLGHLVKREGGWNAVQDWPDVLSGREKQRVAMSRCSTTNRSSPFWTSALLP